jgi:hypothetical protein
MPELEINYLLFTVYCLLLLLFAGINAIAFVPSISCCCDVPYVPDILTPVLRIRIRIRRIRMFFGLLDPYSDPLVRGMDPDPDPDPSITKHK